MAGVAQKVGPASAGLRLLACAAALAPAPAFAGAWIAPEHGQEIWTYAAGEDVAGSFYETSVYWEAPFGSAPVSLVATPWMQQSPTLPEGWRGEATLGLKDALWRGRNSVVAVQAGAFWNSEPGESCGEGGAELRLLGGMNVGENGRAFLNLEAAARTLQGGCADTRVDFTAGYRPSEHWMGLAEVFVDDPEGGDQSIKAQLTLVHFGREDKAMQFGVRTRIDGGSSEAALVLSFWGRPGR